MLLTSSKCFQATGLLLPLLLMLLACDSPATEGSTALNYPDEKISLNSQLAASLADKIRQEANVSIDDGLELSLWASDSLVTDPIAISVAPDGRVFYTSATRQRNSEFDIRGHRDWITASISFQTIEERRDFLRATFAPDSSQSQRFLQDLNKDGVLDWRDLAVEKERVWFVSDQDLDGVADQAQLYLEDFGDEVTDVANGLTYHQGEVYIGVAPDLWRTKDTDGDGIADTKTSISHGYAVHIGFSGHGMSGVTVGPLGRIWWGIGDIGMNVVDKSGKHWKYPNRGVVVRSQPDGSDFEVFAMGVRNTHEFVFDEYGNLISVDNDGDHPGERERLVYLIDGSDTGWRINWQFGKYTDPSNNDYKVWMDEQLHLPRWEGQAAYILPTITNYVNGPTGMVYNPGTALGPDWYRHFFVAEFRGSPTNSPIHAFTLEADGAGFQLGKSKEIAKGLLPTGIDWTADGSLLFADWINGWGPKEQGRIWKLDVPADQQLPIRKATQALLQADFSDSQAEALADLLAHQDQRVRQKAQLELAGRGKKQFPLLLSVAQSANNQLARIHALWGMTQLARGNEKLAAQFLPFLQDKDPEIIAQAAKLIGDIRYGGAGEALLPLLQHPAPRVRFFATEALGRTADAAAVPAIIALLRANDDQDTWLRAGAMIALGRIGQAAPLAALKDDPSKAVRTAAVVALRRMESPAIAVFLQDADEYIVAEAARGINDDFSIEAALPALAACLDDERLVSEVVLRRAINANNRLGGEEHYQRLIRFAAKPTAPEAMRAEAIHTLAHWANPSVFDRVDGRYRGSAPRSSTALAQAISSELPALLSSPSAAVKAATILAAGQLNTQAAIPQLRQLLQTDQAASVRAAALQSLHQLQAEGLTADITRALADRESSVRAKGLEILPTSAIPSADAVALYTNILQKGSLNEQQTALQGLGKIQDTAASNLLAQLVQKMSSGKLAPALQLELLEALEQQKESQLIAQLATYTDKLPGDYGLFRTTLAGGDIDRGRTLFYESEAAQCVRCHAVWEYGGNVGPGLEGIGKQLSRAELLEALIRPSARIAPGYETLIVTLKDSSAVSGTLLSRNRQGLKLQIGKEDILQISNQDLLETESLPSSMPSAETKLSKREIRDIIAFLESLG